MDNNEPIIAYHYNPPGKYILVGDELSFQDEAGNIWSLMEEGEETIATLKE